MVVHVPESISDTGTTIKKDKSKTRFDFLSGKKGVSIKLSFVPLEHAFSFVIIHNPGSHSRMVGTDFQGNTSSPPVCCLLHQPSG